MCVFTLNKRTIININDYIIISYFVQDNVRVQLIYFLKNRIHDVTPPLSIYSTIKYVNFLVTRSGALNYFRFDSVII